MLLKMPLHSEFRKACPSFHKIQSKPSVSLNAVKLLLPSLVLVILIAPAFAEAPSTSPSSPPYVIGEEIASPEGPVDAARPVVKLLVTQFAKPNIHYPVVEDTIEIFRKTFGRGNFSARVYSGETKDIGDADLVLSSAGTYGRMLGGGARDLATVVSSFAPDPNHAEGALFITLRKRADIDKFEDLKGKKATATGPNAFAGWHIALGEIASRSFNPDRFFSDLIPSGHDMTRELDLLRSGAADVAVVRTCFLEELANAGEDVSDIKPIAVKPGIHPAGCLSSTRLYPNWTIFATPRLSPQNARLATQALLSMLPGPHDLSWGIASDFSSVDNLYRAIRRGPYEYLRSWTWRRFWDEYKTYVLLLFFSIAGLAAHAARSSYLVRLRTAELKDALHREQESEKKARIASERMETLRRAGAVGQMSSIIAHELRQPLSAIVSYSQGLQRMLDTDVRAPADVLLDGISSIRSQAERAEDIVGKVRSYAKGEAPARVRTDLGQLCRKAVRTLNDARISPVKVAITTPAETYFIHADPMEIELAIQNLLRNALQAVANTANGEVSLILDSCEGSDDRRRAVISICDNGPLQNDESFEKLNSILTSSKIKGLGLGLAIVRTIAENLGGRLKFARRRPNGLTALLILPLQNEEKRSNES